MPTILPSRSARRGGFTLIELLVVVLIVGVLAAFAIPQLIRTMESTKADDAAGIVKMIATANRMYFIDHARYTNNSSQLTTACGAVGCDATKYDACQLVACKYLGSMDWDSKAYSFYTCDGTGANCCGVANITPTTANTQVVACAKRKNDAQQKYTNWGYSATVTGQMGYYPGDGTPSNPSAPKPPS